jgi:hypothetical protein
MNTKSCLLTTALLVTGASALLAQGESEEPKLSAEALRLQAAYHQAVERAVQPVRERYLSELKRVQEAATRSGKLDEALAIRREIQALSAAPAAGLNSNLAFERRLHNTSWLWSKEIRFTFKPDGSTPGRDFTWSTVKPLTITFKYPAGWHGTIQFDAALTTAAVEEIDPNGKKSKFSLTRAKD